MSPELRVRQIIANVGAGNADMETHTTLDDLGFDSLDCVELSVKIAAEFGFGPHWIMEDYLPSDTVGRVQADVLKHLAGSK